MSDPDIQPGYPLRWPFPRVPSADRFVAHARRRMESAPSAPAVADDALAVDASAIAALMDAKLLAAIAGDAPAVRRIVAAIAIAGVATRDQLADLAGVSITSSHLGVGLRRLVERGILADTGSGFILNAKVGRV